MYASYRYSDFDDRVSELEKRYTPKFVREHGAPVAIVLTLVIEKRITWKWSFE